LAPRGDAAQDDAVDAFSRDGETFSCYAACCTAARQRGAGPCRPNDERPDRRSLIAARSHACNSAAKRRLFPDL